MELKGVSFITFGLIILSILLISVLTVWTVHEIYSLIDTSRTGLELIASLRKMQGYTYNLLIAENVDIAYLKWHEAAVEFEESLSDFHNSPRLHVLLKDQSVLVNFKAFSILSERALSSIETIEDDYAMLSDLIDDEGDHSFVFLNYSSHGAVKAIAYRFREIGNYFSSSYEDTITPLVDSIEKESIKVQRQVLIVFMLLFLGIVALAGGFSLYIGMYERKRKEETMQLEIQKNKFELLEYFAGGLAHDFNNYFSAILCNIGLAKDSAVDNAELMEILNDVEYASTQASGLTNQFMTFARKDTSKKKIVDIGGLLRNTAGFILRGSSIYCTVNIQENLFNVEIDESQISEVINNLLINAKQALPDGGSIAVRAENITIARHNPNRYRPGNYVHISIADNGHGIPDKIKKEVTNPFFTTKKNGSGLGLAICYSIIQKNGGYINFVSAVNVGTTFNILLHGSTKPVSGHEREKESLTRGSGRILIMDDDERVLSTLERMLKVLGYKAFPAVNGEDAIRKYSEALKDGERFDLVILDYTIANGMGGKEAVRQLLNLDPEVKAVLSSGYDVETILPDYRSRGFTAFLKKAYTIQELSKVIESCLGG